MYQFQISSTGKLLCESGLICIGFYLKTPNFYNNLNYYKESEIYSIIDLI